MLEELDILIVFILQKYNDLSNEWNEISKHEKINLNRIEVREINDNNKILDKIFDYRIFINENNIDLKLAIKELKLKNDVNTRVKLRNSIEFKINNYIRTHEEGKVPVIKCLNDIYGIRIIFEDNVQYKEIKDFVEKNYKGVIKCIESIRGDYVATHLYFKKDNYNFPWELQIWDKEHEQSNLKSHEIYKQDYVKWEKEVKGGV